MEIIFYLIMILSLLAKFSPIFLALAAMRAANEYVRRGKAASGAKSFLQKLKAAYEALK